MLMWTLHLRAQTCCSDSLRGGRVAISVVRAEFPQWEVIAAYGIFSLSSQRRASLNAILAEGTGEELFELSSRRLGHVFKVSVDSLRSQHADHEPIARRRFLETSSATFDAWRYAVRRTQGNKGSRERHPADALSHVLCSFAVCGGSSSGVEQAFSKLMSKVKCQQLHGRAEYEEDVVLCAIARDYAWDDELTHKAINFAQLAWSSVYGAARACPATPRIDTGCQKKASSRSESSWIRSRREAVGQALRQGRGHRHAQMQWLDGPSNTRKKHTSILTS